jgi:Ca2+-binding RTX toxin-like protein
VLVPAELYGGDGNDDLHGGRGNDILDGGAGDDILHSGGGRDLLIGGLGADSLFGQSGEDLLIAGDFMDGARFGDRRQDLITVQAGWTGSGSYLERIAALDAFLGARVSDDGVADRLVGGGGFDWFFARMTGPTADQLLGLNGTEIIHELP